MRHVKRRKPGIIRVCDRAHLEMTKPPNTEEVLALARPSLPANPLQQRGWAPPQGEIIRPTVYGERYMMIRRLELPVLAKSSQGRTIADR